MKRHEGNKDEKWIYAKIQHMNGAKSSTDICTSQTTILWKFCVRWLSSTWGLSSLAAPSTQIFLLYDSGRGERGREDVMITTSMDKIEGSTLHTDSPRRIQCRADTHKTRNGYFHFIKWYMRLATHSLLIWANIEAKYCYSAGNW